MKINKLFTLISITLSIFLFSTAAICIQCSVTYSTEEEIVIGDDPQSFDVFDH